MFLLMIRLYVSNYYCCITLITCVLNSIAMNKMLFLLNQLFALGL